MPKKIHLIAEMENDVGNSLENRRRPFFENGLDAEAGKTPCSF